MRFLYTLGFFAVVGVLMPSAAEAARIYLDPEEATYNQLDTFYVPVRIDTQEECINAVSVRLSYDATRLSILDVSIGDSILSLWTLAPTIVKEESEGVGRILFEGGVPGGYCGRIEGDSEQTNVLVKLVVSGALLNLAATDTAQASIIVDPDTAAYLHDGTGSPAQLTVLGADLHFIHSTATPINVWLADVTSDTVSPEFFDIILVEAPSQGSNKHYIAFSTTDKQSGVDHYEVLETDPDRFGFLTWVPRSAHWVVAESPYILRDQKLRSKILVRAIDKRGNVRTVEYLPAMSPLTQLSQPSIFVPIITILVIIAAISHIVISRRRRRTRDIHTDNVEPSANKE